MKSSQRQSKAVEVIEKSSPYKGRFRVDRYVLRYQRHQGGWTPTVVIKKHQAAYLTAVGGAAYLVAKAIRSARVLAFEDLGMEAIHEFEVKDMPVTVAVDANGDSVHQSGPAEWRKKIVELKLPVATA